MVDLYSREGRVAVKSAQIKVRNNEAIIKKKNRDSEVRNQQKINIRANGVGYKTWSQRFLVGLIIAKNVNHKKG